MNKSLIKMQGMLMRQMIRLDELDTKVEVNKQEEISRANALSQTAVTYLKSVNTSLRLMEVSKKYEIKEEELSEKIGTL